MKKFFAKFVDEVTTSGPLLFLTCAVVLVAAVAIIVGLYNLIS